MTLSIAADRPFADLIDLTGRGAVVTGAAAGIGFAIAARLAEAGAPVTLFDRDAAGVERAVGRLGDMGRRARAFVGDVTDEAALRRAAATTEASGGIDIWVNNAGIYPFRAVRDMSAADWDRVLNTNLKGTFLGARVAADHLVPRGGGVILNLSSVAGIKPSAVGLAHYDASKAAILAFTRNLALELAPHGIRVAALAPGEIDTEGTRANAAEASAIDPDLEQTSAAYLARIPLGRLGTPDDVARVALFLVSAAAAYLTGSAVVVDGGILLT